MKLNGSNGLTLYSKLRASGVPSAASTRPSTNADAGQRETLPDDQLQHVAAVGAKRDAHADFLGPLRHRVGEHAVDANRRQQHADDTNRPEDPAIQPELPELAPAHVLERPHPVDGDVRIRRAKRRARRRGDRRRITGDANGQPGVQRLPIAIGRERRRRGLRVRRIDPEQLQVGRDADHGEPLAANRPDSRA